jgi:cytochrome b6-f complex iron-sulfur subunit
VRNHREIDDITSRRFGLRPPEQERKGRAYCLQRVTAMENPKTTRRDFCAQTISFVTVASLLEGCGGGGSGNPGGPSGGGNVPQLTIISATTAGNTVTINNVSGTALANQGSAALVQSGSNSFLVTRTGQDTFNAFTAVCTHEQCIVTGFQSGTFVCPCHGSQYNTSGTVVQGPATQRLRQFTTQFTNNVLTITV